MLFLARSIISICCGWILNHAQLSLLICIKGISKILNDRLARLNGHQACLIQLQELSNLCRQYVICLKKVKLLLSDRDLSLNFW